MSTLITGHGRSGSANSLLGTDSSSASKSGGSSFNDNNEFQGNTTIRPSTINLRRAFSGKSKQPNLKQLTQENKDAAERFSDVDKTSDDPAEEVKSIKESIQQFKNFSADKKSQIESFIKNFSTSDRSASDTFEGGNSIVKIANAHSISELIVSFEAKFKSFSDYLSRNPSVADQPDILAEVENILGEIKDLKELRQKHMDSLGDLSKDTHVERKTHISPTMLNKAVAHARLNKDRTNKEHHSIFKNIIASGKENGVYTAQGQSQYLDESSQIPAKILHQMLAGYHNSLSDKAPEVAKQLFLNMYKLDINDKDVPNTRTYKFVQSLKAYGIEDWKIQAIFRAGKGAAAPTLQSVLPVLKEFSDEESEAIGELADYADIKAKADESDAKLSAVIKLAYGLRALGISGMKKERRTSWLGYFQQKRALPDSWDDTQRNKVCEALKVCIDKEVIDLTDITDPKLPLRKSNSERYLPNLPFDKESAKNYVQGLTDTKNDGDLGLILKVVESSVKEMQFENGYGGKVLIHAERFKELQSDYTNAETAISQGENHTSSAYVQGFYEQSRRLVKGSFLNTKHRVTSTISYVGKEVPITIGLGLLTVAGFCSHIKDSFFVGNQYTTVTDEQLKTVNDYRAVMGKQPLSPGKTNTILKRDFDRAFFGSYSGFKIFKWHAHGFKIAARKTWLDFKNTMPKSSDKYHSPVGEGAIALDGAFAQVSDYGGYNAEPWGNTAVFGNFLGSDIFNVLFQSSFTGLKFRKYIDNRVRIAEREIGRNKQFNEGVESLKKNLMQKSTVVARDTMIQQVAELSNIMANSDGYRVKQKSSATDTGGAGLGNVLNKDIKELTSVTPLQVSGRDSIRNNSDLERADKPLSYLRNRTFTSIVWRTQRWLEENIPLQAWPRYVFSSNLFGVRAGYLAVATAKGTSLNGLKAGLGMKFTYGGLVSATWGFGLLGALLVQLQAARHIEGKYVQRHTDARKDEGFQNNINSNVNFKIGADIIQSATKKSKTVSNSALVSAYSWEAVFGSLVIYNALVIAGGGALKAGLAASAPLLGFGVVGIAALEAGYNIWAARVEKAKQAFKQYSADAVLDGGRMVLDADRPADTKRGTDKSEGYLNARRNATIQKLAKKYPEWHLDKDATRLNQGEVDEIKTLVKQTIHDELPQVNEIHQKNTDKVVASVMNKIGVAVRRDVVVNADAVKDIVEGYIAKDIRDIDQAVDERAENDDFIQGLSSADKVRAVSVMNLREEASGMTLIHLVDSLRHEMQVTDQSEIDALKKTHNQEAQNLRAVNQSAGVFDVKFNYKSREIVRMGDMDKTAQNIATFLDRGEVDANRFERSPTAQHLLAMKMPKYVIQAIADSSPSDKNDAAAIKTLKIWLLGK